MLVVVPDVADPPAVVNPAAARSVSPGDPPPSLPLPLLPPRPLPPLALPLPLLARCCLAAAASALRTARLPGRCWSVATAGSVGSRNGFAKRRPSKSRGL